MAYKWTRGMSARGSCVGDASLQPPPLGSQEAWACGSTNSLFDGCIA